MEAVPPISQEIGPKDDEETQADMSLMTPQNNISAAVETQSELTFTLFPKLPPELRVKIWESIDLEPRVIYVTHGDEDEAANLIDVTCHYPVPALLHTNRESRRTALKVYTPLEENSVTYISLSTDVLSFSCDHASEIYLQKMKREQSPDAGVTSRQEILAGIKHLVFDDHYDDYSIAAFTEYTNLKRLRSFTISDSYIDKEIETEEDAKMRAEGYWENGKAPQIFFISKHDMQKMKNGDSSWLQEKLAEVDSDKSKLALRKTKALRGKKA